MNYTITTTDLYHEVLFESSSMGYKILQQFPLNLSPEELEQAITEFKAQFPL